MTTKAKTIYYSIVLFKDEAFGEAKQVVEEWVKIRRKTDGAEMYKCISTPFSLPKRCGPVQYIPSIKPTLAEAFRFFAETQRRNAENLRKEAEQCEVEAKKAEERIQWMEDISKRAVELVADDFLNGDF